MPTLQPEDHPLFVNEIDYPRRVAQVGSAGSILDISKHRDTCERSISIFDSIAILGRYIE